ncbi:hypothetical protein [Streptomyces sp. NPDC005969]|uniref:hypothetical protein n=1 Tax=Streptomyces sp. NPDC005969 TaxID=3156722 RepID=UPI0033F0512F
MGAEFAGELETHLTVRLDTAVGAMDASSRLEHWAGRTGLKLTRIALDRGSMPDQPMPTETGRGPLTERRAAALLRSAELRAADFPVIRVKIEAAPWNADIPQMADEAAALSPVGHFEAPHQAAAGGTGGGHGTGRGRTAQRAPLAQRPPCGPGGGARAVRHPALPRGSAALRPAPGLGRRRTALRSESASRAVGAGLWASDQM